MSKEKEQLEEQLSVLASRLDTWKKLVEHPGWKMLKELAEHERNIRQQAVCLTPINEMSQAFAQEFYKGEFSGIALVLTKPEAQIELLTVERASLMVQLENEDEMEAAISAAGRSRVDQRDWYGGEPADDASDDERGSSG